MSQEFDVPREATFEWVVNAMNRAADRMIHVHWHEPDRAFAVIGETLWWICVLDEMLRTKNQSAYEDGRPKDERASSLLLGMRYARNCIAHSVDVLEYIEPTAVLRTIWASQYQASWRWRQLPPVQEKRGRTGEEEYERVVAGYDVKQTLVEALTFLRSSARSCLADNSP